MKPLRREMIEDMQLAGFSPRTQEAYVRGVRQLAELYMKSPDQIDESRFVHPLRRQESRWPVPMGFGKVVDLKVTPEARRKNIVVCGE